MLGGRTEVQAPHIFSDFFFFSSDETENILNIKKSTQHPKTFTENSGFWISLPLHFLSFEIPLLFSLIPINLALSMIPLFPTLTDLLINHVRYGIVHTHTHTPTHPSCFIQLHYREQISLHGLDFCLVTFSLSH